MSTTTIGSMTLGTSANLTGAAKLEFEDSAGASVYFTAATLRTKIFAGSTGYTAADPLVAGTANFSGAVTVAAGGITVTSGGIVISASGMNVTGTATFNTQVLTVASATGASGLRIPHGAAPTSPTNGDIWTTTAGLFVRINGATVGPLT